MATDAQLDRANRENLADNLLHGTSTIDTDQTDRPPQGLPKQLKRDRGQENYDENGKVYTVVNKSDPQFNRDGTPAVGMPNTFGPKKALALRQAAIDARNDTRNPDPSFASSQRWATVGGARQFNALFGQEKTRVKGPTTGQAVEMPRSIGPNKVPRVLAEDGPNHNMYGHEVAGKKGDPVLDVNGGAVYDVVDHDEKKRCLYHPVEKLGFARKPVRLTEPGENFDRDGKVVEGQKGDIKRTADGRAVTVTALPPRGAGLTDRQMPDGKVRDGGADLCGKLVNAAKHLGATVVESSKAKEASFDVVKRAGKDPQMVITVPEPGKYPTSDHRASDIARAASHMNQYRLGEPDAVAAYSKPASKRAGTAEWKRTDLAAQHAALHVTTNAGRTYRAVDPERNKPQREEWARHIASKEGYDSFAKTVSKSQRQLEGRAATKSLQHERNVERRQSSARHAQQEGRLPVPLAVSRQAVMRGDAQQKQEQEAASREAPAGAPDRSAGARDTGQKQDQDRTGPGDGAR